MSPWQLRFSTAALVMALVIASSIASVSAASDDDDDDAVPKKERSLPTLLRQLAQGRERVVRVHIEKLPDKDLTDRCLEILQTSNDQDLIVGTAIVLGWRKQSAEALTVVRYRLDDTESALAQDKPKKADPKASDLGKFRLSLLEAFASLDGGKESARFEALIKSGSPSETAAAARGLINSHSPAGTRTLMRSAEALRAKVANLNRRAEASKSDDFGADSKLTKELATANERLQRILGHIKNGLRKSTHASKLVEGMRSEDSHPTILETLESATRLKVRTEVGRLGSSLRDHSDAPQRAIAMKLIAIGRRDNALEQIVTGLEDPIPAVRIAASAALPRLARKKARTEAMSLVALLEDTDLEVRGAAHQALIKLYGVKVPGTAPAWARYINSVKSKRRQKP